MFQENPSEEDAAIVDKILSMRVTKKEASIMLLTVNHKNLVKSLF